MVREVSESRRERRRRERERKREEAIPPGTEHFVIIGRDIRAHPPSGYPPDDDGNKLRALNYEHGDEVPYEVGERQFHDLTESMIALDADGERLAGGRKTVEGFANPEKVLANPELIEDAMERWESGEGFDPSDYG